MTEFLLWLPLGVVGIILMVLLAVVRWPDELDPEPLPAGARRHSLRAGALRLAVVHRIGDVVVVDGVVDEASLLGPVGSLVTLVFAAVGIDPGSYERLWQWAASDSVVDIVVPAGGPPHRQLDLRHGDAEVRLPVVGLST